MHAVKPNLVDFLCVCGILKALKEDSMSDKKSMTLNLNEAEMAALDELAKSKELSKTAVIRQALRLYTLIEARTANGEKLVLEDEKLEKKAELMVL